MNTEDDAVKYRALIELFRLYRSRHQCTSKTIGSFVRTSTNRRAEGYDIDVVFRVGDTVYTEGEAEARVYQELSRRIHGISDGSDNVSIHKQYAVRAKLPSIHSVPSATMRYAKANISGIEPPAQACENFLRTLLTRRHFEALVAPRLHDMMDSYRPAMQAGRRAYAAFIVLRTYLLIGKDLLWPVMQIVLRYWGGSAED